MPAGFPFVVAPAALGLASKMQKPCFTFFTDMFHPGRFGPLDFRAHTTKNPSTIMGRILESWNRNLAYPDPEERFT